MAQAVGRRDCQEDAIITNFMIGSGVGFVVLADGMGGHAAGDIASRIVVTEVFSELTFQTPQMDADQADIPAVLRAAALAADHCIAAHMMTDFTTQGMGATLVAPVIVHDALWWISIGDSPLFLFRDGQLLQLNEDHSLAPQIEYMMANGMMDADIGLVHPDRNVLTSALFGGQITQIDCPSVPLSLQIGDILIAASDGLQFLDNASICQTLSAMQAQPAADIARTLLDGVTDLNHPDQDNVSFSVIRVLSDATTAQHRGIVGPLHDDQTALQPLIRAG